jgi:hypothetical protein
MTLTKREHKTFEFLLVRYGGLNLCGPREMESVKLVIRANTIRKGRKKFFFFLMCISVSFGCSMPEQRSLGLFEHGNCYKCIHSSPFYVV